jgi:LmbE family N-acetylglucosaminyl deacetylase
LKKDDADKKLIKQLRERSKEAAQCLGAKEVTFYDLPDNRFDTLPLLEVVKIVEDLIEMIKPQVIYTHHPGDLNIDHVVTHRAVITASRPQGGVPVKAIYAFEVPSSTEWTFGQTLPPFRPNVFVDISETVERKVKAMSMYETEIRSFPHPRSPEALRVIARRWGSVVGYQAAEAFELIREIR